MSQRLPNRHLPGDRRRLLTDGECAAFRGVDDAFETIVKVGFALMAEMDAENPLARDSRPPLAETIPERELFIAMRDLARVLASSLVDLGSADDVAACLARAQSRASDLLAESPMSALAREMLSGLPDGAMAQAHGLIALYGVVEHGVRIQLRETERGVFEVNVEHLSPAKAHQWLVKDVMERLADQAIGNRLMSVELHAAAWWFDQHCYVPESRLEGDAQDLRGLEWAMLDRTTIANETTLIHAFCRGAVFEDLHPKQREIARALCASFAGAFVVREQREHTMLLEDMAGSRERYEVMHLWTPSTCRPGDLALGRLVPLSDGGYVHFESMVFIHAAGTDLDVEIGEDLRTDGLADAALNVESVITALNGGGTRYPLKDPLPAENPVHARERLEDARTTLREAGLERTSQDEPWTPATWDSEWEATPGFEHLEQVTRDFLVDQIVAMWMRALAIQAAS